MPGRRPGSGPPVGAAAARGAAAGVAGRGRGAPAPGRTSCADRFQAAALSSRSTGAQSRAPGRHASPRGPWPLRWRRGVVLRAAQACPAGRASSPTRPTEAGRVCRSRDGACRRSPGGSRGAVSSLLRLGNRAAYGKHRERPGGSPLNRDVTGHGERAEAAEPDERPCAERAAERAGAGRGSRPRPERAGVTPSRRRGRSVWRPSGCGRRPSVSRWPCSCARCPATGAAAPLSRPSAHPGPRASPP